MDTQTLKTIPPNFPTFLDSIGMCAHMKLILGSVRGGWEEGNALQDTLSGQKSIYFEMRKEPPPPVYMLLCKVGLSLWPLSNISYVNTSQNKHILSRRALG